MDKLEAYLLTIYGIGESTVRAAAYAVLKVDPEVLSKPAPAKIRAALKKVPNLSKLTLADLQYNPLKHFKRSIVGEIDAEFSRILNGRVKYEIAGSYRRKKSFCGDVDFMYIGSFEMIRKMFNEKSKKGAIMEPYASGDQKITTMIKWKGKYYKGDFYVTTKESWPVMLVHLTGNYIFNVYLRTTAQKKGYLLNQYGLFKNGKAVKITTEKQLFEKLGVRWHKPEERELTQLLMTKT
jgi:DNA polymerase/3'-5' exonuclease PolX